MRIVRPFAGIATPSATARLAVAASLAVARSLAVALALVGAAVSTARAATPPPDAPEAPATLQAACDGDPWAHTLVPGSPIDARAVWLDRRWIQWPGTALREGERFRLLHAPRGGLDIRLGRPAPEATDSMPLAAHADRGAVPLPVRARSRHLEPGAVLRVAPMPDARLKDLLRGEVVVVREASDGTVIDVTALQHPLALDDLYAARAWSLRLGARPTDRGTRFTLWAPTARAVYLCLHRDASARAHAITPLAFDATTGAWQARVPRNLHGTSYTYLVEAHVPGTGLVRNRVTDPSSVSLTADSRRSVALDLQHPSTMPPGWRRDRGKALRAKTDLVAYELHVRDFSAADASVPAAHRGKFLAFTHAGSHGMRHLRALAQAGVTDVHLLPIFDFATVPERGCVDPARPADAMRDGPQMQAAVRAVADRDCYNWGYDPLHVDAPEGSYATDPDDGARRVRELRAMVMALHRAGLRVGMDVVYNHMSASGQHAKSILDRVVPGYHHRLDATGKVERSTCCDNTATEHAMTAKAMIDSARHWVRHHHIDSLRFDLMGHQPRDAMLQLQRAVDREARRRVPLIGEGWNFGEVADGKRFVQAAQGRLAGSGIATFDDRLRDALRGGGCCDRGEGLVTQRGFVHGPSPTLAPRVAAALGGSLVDADSARGRGDSTGSQPYATEPDEVVHYAENHDNQTLFDVAALKLPVGTPRGEVARVQVLANAVVLLSQGIAYLHAGQELMRSKSMDRNSYDSGDAFNRIDWRGIDHAFGVGLPPAGDNEDSWPWMQPRLADTTMVPSPAHIAWVRDATFDLLRIRAGARMLRLDSAAEIRKRVVVEPTDADGAVVAATIDGRGLAGSRFQRMAVLINVDSKARDITIATTRGLRLRVHPQHRTDAVARTQSAHDTRSGRFTVPARTAVVFVGAAAGSTAGR